MLPLSLAREAESMVVPFIEKLFCAKVDSANKQKAKIAVIVSFIIVIRFRVR